MKFKKTTLILSFLIFSFMLVCDTPLVSDVCIIEVEVHNNLSTSSLEDSHVLEWNFTWGGDYHESSYAINYDSLGNVYIAGTTNYTFTGNDDIFLAKFNNSGHFQWNQTWGEDGNEEVWEIAIDSLNNIYMAGSIDSGYGQYKYLLVKYDNLGNYQWNRTCGGIYGSDLCFGIALDSTENIYLVGSMHDFTGIADICLVKFNSLGQYQWNRTWSGGYQNEGYDIEIDSSDNIYITGYYWRELDDCDLCLIKYNNIGDYQWNRTYDLSSHDQGIEIALDSTDNIYISGLISNSSILDSLLLFLKFNSDGNLIIDKTWGDPGMNTFYDIDLDTGDNIYIAGIINYSAFTNHDFCLIQFNTNGVEQFFHKWGSTDIDGYHGMVIDQSDNIYLTGTRNTDEIYLEKYSKRETPSNGEPSGSIISFGSTYLIFIVFGIVFLIAIEQWRRKS
ncbi:MAG: hypothetical protein ACFFFT_03410 [Candidatus Thorarchaeota archaeon]